jgi:hypothetical protein
MIKFEIDDRVLTARLGSLSKRVHDALLAVMKPAADSVAGEARNLAAEHIRFVGKKPGQYLASIYGGSFDKGERVGGFVRSGNPLAHLLESGATLPEHDILPDVASVLHFEGSAGEVFARVTHFPGAPLPPYPAIEPAFEGAEARLRALIESTVRDVAGQT